MCAVSLTTYPCRLEVPYGVPLDTRSVLNNSGCVAVLIVIKAHIYQVRWVTRNTATEIIAERRSDWEMWTAAIMTDITARDLFIGSVKKWASDGLSSQPLGDWYEATGGQPESFRARPVVGGHLGT